MNKRLRNFLLFIAIIVLAAALYLSRMNFNAQYNSASGTLDGISAPSQ